MSISSFSSVSGVDTSQIENPSSLYSPSANLSLSQAGLPEPKGDDPALIGFVYKNKGISYTFKEKSASFRKGVKPSRIWSEGYEANSEPGTCIWVCGRCWNQRNSKGFVKEFKCYTIGKTGLTTTKHAMGHLRQHEKNELRADQPSHKRKRNVYEQLASQTSEDRIPSQADVNIGREKLIRWVIAARISLHSIELEEFREFIQVLAPNLAVYLQPTRNTVRQWIMDEFAQKKKVVKQELLAAVSKIHLSFDLWTSESSLAIIGIVAHYLSANLDYRTRVIALRSIEGPHSGENQAPVIADVIEHYKIKDKLGYFITDNAGHNDTAIHSLCSILGLNANTRRLRCLGHIINLAAKAFLYGKNADTFEIQMSNLDLKKLEEKHYQEVLAAWRKKGPIGKLHNIVVWIRQSPQRRQQFKDIELKEQIAPTKLIVLSDNSTRWNSTYTMIKRGLKLRDHIDSFSRKYRKELLNDIITDDEWEELVCILEILIPFKQVTKRLEGQADKGELGAIWEGLPAIEALLSHMESMKKKYTTHLQLASSINEAWLKLTQYYEKMDESPVYTAAVMLHPRHKFHYFTKRWKSRLSEYIQPTKQILRQQYEKEYLPFYPIQSVLQPVPEIRGLDPLQDYLDEDYEERSNQDQLEAYNSLPQEYLSSGANLFKWWANQLPFSPALTRWAWDIFSIPAMSSECERTFSGAKLTITPVRNLLDADIVEAIEVLNRWHKIERQDEQKFANPVQEEQQTLVPID